MRRRSVALTAAATLVVSAGCGGNAADDDGEQTELRVGVLPITAVAPIYLTEDQGFFEERGLDVEIETAGGGAAVVPSVISGDFDFAFGNVVSLMVARDQDLPIQIVANGMGTTGDPETDSSAIVVPEGSDVETAADLEDGTVAIDNLNNIGDTSVRNSVRVAGGDPERVEFLELDFPDMTSALDNEQVDAVWVTEPFVTIATQAGHREVAANFVDLHPDVSIAGYFTTEEFIAENPEAAEEFTDALNEGLDYAAENPDEVRRILGTFTDIDEDVVEAMRLPHFFTGIDEEAMAHVGGLAAEDGLIDEEPNLDELIR